MTSSHDIAPHAAALDRLSESLASAAALTQEMRVALMAGDAAAIDARTLRLENLLVEIRAVITELEKSPQPATSDDASLTAARERFEATATRLAREGAVSGGMLAGLVARVRSLFEQFAPNDAASYGSDGRPPERAALNLRLKELA